MQDTKNFETLTDKQIELLAKLLKITPPYSREEIEIALEQYLKDKLLLKNASVEKTISDSDFKMLEILYP